MTGSSTLRLGLDLGTSAVKAVALDGAGSVIAAGEAGFATSSELPGQAEQETGAWLDATAAAAAALAREVGAGWRHRIAGIGLAGQLPTLVCLGAEAPLGPAIAWSDSRADAWAATRLDEERRDALYRRTGMPIDGRYLAPMFRFHWRARRDEVRRILSAKDYLCYALTGRAVTDPSTAAGYGLYDLAEAGWSAELAAEWDLDPRLLPALQPADATAGPLSSAGARMLNLPEGLPVAVGAADSVAGALAMSAADGGLDTGRVSLVMGSGTVIIDAVRERRLDPHRRYLLTPHARAGWYGREMDVLATGSGFRWLGRLLGRSDAEIEAVAATSPPGARGLLFAPYLAGGEQGALWDPHLSGVLHGLSLHHGAGDIARAFIEGAQFEIRRCLEVLAEAGPVRRIVLAGHRAGSPAGLQMLADVLARPIEAFPHLSPAAVGAALLAGPSGPRSSQAGPWPRAEPGPGAATYEGIYRRYRALFPRAARPE